MAGTGRGSHPQYRHARGSPDLEAEPGGKGSRQLGVRSVSHPGDIAVGSDQHGEGGGDLAEHGEFPRSRILGVDEADAVRPRRRVETVGLTESEQHGPGVVQQREDARRTVRGVQVEVGHASSEQRMSLPEVVMDVETREHAAMRRRGSSMLSSSVSVACRASVRSSVRRSAICAMVFWSTRAPTGCRSAW